MMLEVPGSVPRSHAFGRACYGGIILIILLEGVKAASVEVVIIPKKNPI